MNLLLQALEDAGKEVDYYALDLSQKELERTLAQLPAYSHVSAHGLLGTYDDGREWLKSPSVASRQKCILSLGSSIGESVPAQLQPLEPDAALSKGILTEMTLPTSSRGLPMSLATVTPC